MVRLCVRVQAVPGRLLRSPAHPPHPHPSPFMAAAVASAPITDAPMFSLTLVLVGYAIAVRSPAASLSGSAYVTVLHSDRSRHVHKQHRPLPVPVGMGGRGVPPACHLPSRMCARDLRQPDGHRHKCHVRLRCRYAVSTDVRRNVVQMAEHAILTSAAEQAGKEAHAMHLSRQCRARVIARDTVPVKRMERARVTGGGSRMTARLASLVQTSTSRAQWIAVGMAAACKVAYATATQVADLSHLHLWSLLVRCQHVLGTLAMKNPEPDLSTWRAGYLGAGCELEGGDAFCARNCSSGGGYYRNDTHTCDCWSLSASGCVANCSGHGVCTGARANDTCLCDFGFGGAACGDILLMQYVDTRLLLSGGCPGNCSGVSHLAALFWNLVFSSERDSACFMSSTWVSCSGKALATSSCAA